MIKFSIFFSVFLFFSKITVAQTINYLDSSQKGISFRGLSVVTNSVFWVSGSKGTVGKTMDGGLHFNWMKPKGFEKRDFRDIEAFDDKTAIIMAVDSPGIILKTVDGGTNWKIVYQSNLHGIFLDAMAFENNMNGICVGDPINDKFWLIETKDGGETWTEVPAEHRPTAAKGEACFASSGTNIDFLKGKYLSYAFVSGGKKSNIFFMDEASNNVVMPLYMMQGKETTGANSLAMNNKYLAVAGGDFNNYKLGDSTFNYRSLNGKSFQSPKYAPFGYKSCVIFKDENTLIATGLSGTDISSDGGKNWRHFSDVPFHVVQKAKNGNAIYLAGGNGRIAKIIF